MPFLMQKIYKSKYKLIINNLFIFEKLAKNLKHTYKEKIILQSSGL